MKNKRLCSKGHDISIAGRCAGGGCYQCQKIYTKRWYHNNINRDKQRQKKWREKNKKKLKTYQKKYDEVNKEKRKRYMRKWRQDNSSYGKIYHRDRKRRDPLYKMIANLRSRLWHALMAKTWRKNSTFNEYIGCSQSHLKTYLEKKFLRGMIWQNYGEWEIDHIRPLSSASNINDLIKLCHYKNLQPLWVEDNRRKSFTIPF